MMPEFPQHFSKSNFWCLSKLLGNSMRQVSNHLYTDVIILYIAIYKFIDLL